MLPVPMEQRLRLWAGSEALQAWPGEWLGHWVSGLLVRQGSVWAQELARVAGLGWGGLRLQRQMGRLGV